MRWSGFRKVRGQVCKRLRQRLCTLEIDTLDDYRVYLQNHSQEWQQLDGICRVTISRFNRDIMMFRHISEQILPKLVQHVIATMQKPCIRVWSAGCASGEEPYTLNLIWQFEWARRFPQISMQIIATDVNESLLRRAHTACYPFCSIKRLPPEWRLRAFEQQDDLYCLTSRYQKNIDFRFHDVRDPLSIEPFHIILCRNLAFTYYDSDLQQCVIDTIHKNLHPGGFLVLGAHEQLKDTKKRFNIYSKPLSIYQRQSSSLTKPF